MCSSIYFVFLINISNQNGLSASDLRRFEDHVLLLLVASLISINKRNCCSCLQLLQRCGDDRRQVFAKLL